MLVSALYASGDFYWGRSGGTSKSEGEAYATLLLAERWAVPERRECAEDDEHGEQDGDQHRMAHVARERLKAGAWGVSS